MVDSNMQAFLDQRKIDLANLGQDTTDKATRAQ